MQFPSRTLAQWAALVAVAASMAACSGPADRQNILARLNPAFMGPRTWEHYVGTYTGPIHADSMRFGYEGLSTRSIQITLSGRTDYPLVTLKEVNDTSSAFDEYVERKATYTNNPVQRYGAQGWVLASTHAPNQLLVRFRRYGIAVSALRMIMTFNADGSADVDFFGHSGWRGTGELWRVPVAATR